MGARGSGSWVQLLQTLVAREGVEQFGLTSRRVAELLGLAPSAISQYLSGRRLGRAFLVHASSEPARRVARRTIEELVKAQETGRKTARIILEGAAALSELSDASAAGRDTPLGRQRVGMPAEQLRQLAQWLRHRVKVEQVAVTQCMRLAQRARDELTRAVLRQIASDSLRHAEIVASLAPYVDRGVTEALTSGITRREIEALIESERAAEGDAEVEASRHLRGTMAVLLASMEADERKHSTLLRSLLESGFAPAKRPVAAHSS